MSFRDKATSKLRIADEVDDLLRETAPASQALIESQQEISLSRHKFGLLKNVGEELERLVNVHCAVTAAMCGKVFRAQGALFDESATNLEKSVVQYNRMKAKLSRSEGEKRQLREQTRRTVGGLYEKLQTMETELQAARVKVDVGEKKLRQAQEELARTRLVINGRVDNTDHEAFTANAAGLEHAINSMEAEDRKQRQFMADLQHAVDDLELQALKATRDAKRTEIRHKECQTDPARGGSGIFGASAGARAADLPPVPQPPPGHAPHPAGDSDALKKRLPRGFRLCMHHFPPKTRVSTLRALEKQIAEIFVAKHREDGALRTAGDLDQCESNVHAFIHDHFSTKYSMNEGLADKKIVEFVESMRHHHSSSQRVRTLDRFVSASSIDVEDHALDYRAFSVVTQCWFLLCTQPRLKKAGSAGGRGGRGEGMAQGGSAGGLHGAGDTGGSGPVEVLRQDAQKAASLMFSGMQSELSELIKAIRALPAAEGNMAVSLDDVVGAFLEAWLRIDQEYLSGLRDLFDAHARKYIRMPGGFMLEIDPSRTDEDVRPDAEVVQVISMEGFQRVVSASAEAAGGDGAPPIAEDDITEAFNERCEERANDKLKAHARLWKRHLCKHTGKHYYFSRNLGLSFWERPPLEDFERGELEFPYFVKVCGMLRLGAPKHKWYV
jgi:hypothetical protein